MKPYDEIPSPAFSIGKSLLIIPPMKHDIGSRPRERGETSFGPSLQYAKRVLKSVLSSWIETLSLGHLEAEFGMIKHVQDILIEREESVWTLQVLRLLLMKSLHWATSGLKPRASQMVTSLMRCF